MGHQQTTVHGSTEGRNDGLPLDMGCHGMDGKLSKKSEVIFLVVSVVKFENRWMLYFQYTCI